MPGGAFLDWPGPIAFAHRGGAGDWPENTLPAFAGAVALGYHYVETDVHVTSDGVLLAFHDERLDRVTDRTGLIRELPWSQVQLARVDGAEPIPRFEELVETWPELRINIEPKHDSAVEPLARSLQRLNAIDRVCVGSFSGSRIKRIRQLLGDQVCTSFGPWGTARAALAGFGLPVASHRDDCLQVPTSIKGLPLVTGRFVRAAHRNDLPVHVWTIDEPAEMHRLLDLGVDGIMTDRPAVLRDVLVERGQWVT